MENPTEKTEKVKVQDLYKIVSVQTQKIENLTKMIAENSFKKTSNEPQSPEENSSHLHQAPSQAAALTQPQHLTYRDMLACPNCAPKLELYRASIKPEMEAEFKKNELEKHKSLKESVQCPNCGEINERNKEPCTNCGSTAYGRKVEK